MKLRIRDGSLYSSVLTVQKCKYRKCRQLAWHKQIALLTMQKVNVKGYTDLV